MKINFIRQISDDILKENHDLRSNIILIKQQLQNFEDNMIAFIRQFQVQIPIMVTPHQTLALFMKTISSKLADFQLQNKKYKVSNKNLKQNNNELQLKYQQLKKQLTNNSEREIKWKQQCDGIQKKYYNLAKKYSQFQIRQQSLKEEIRSINERNIMQRNIQEQLKKKQIEGVKLVCHSQLRELRDKIEFQNIELEKKFKDQIQEKEKRIKQLEKIMEKLASDIKLDTCETTILKTVLQAFQQSHKSRKMIEQLKQQNCSFKKNINDLEKEKLQLQSKLMEKNIFLHNLQSQYEILRIHKLEFEKNLGAKIKEMEKSQKDKKEIQQYYDRKWNSDFNKVKTHLQKAFIQRSQELQMLFARRMQQFEDKMIEWVQKINMYEHKNKELQRIHTLDSNQKRNLRKQIQKLHLQLKNLNQQLQETWKMSRQQIVSIKEIKLEQDIVYKSQIKNLIKELKKRQNNIEAQTQRIQAIVKELNQKHQIQMKTQLENQQKIFLQNTLEIKKDYQMKIKNLREQVYQSQKQVEKVKQQISKQFQKEIQLIKQRHQKQIKQKEEDMQKKMQKISYKLRDYENKVASSKKQQEEIFLKMDKQRLLLQKQMENLKNKLKNSENQLKMGYSDKKQLVQMAKEMDKKMANLQEIIKTNNREMEEIKTNEKKAQDKAFQLINIRSSWLNQLLQVQNSYKKQFNQLKSNFDKQINFYKSRIWQLERQYKNQPISKKNYEKILSLHSEKEELKNALDIKEAENIVLTQVKELYETQLQISQIKINSNQPKDMKPKFRRKIDIHRKFTEIENVTLRNSHVESNDVIKMKKYIKQSYKKHQYLSLTKARYKQVTDFKRVKTTQI